MATSVKKKGLLKGLRCFSQMFVEERKEMQIGLPTDVKHVAHIGWDGPSANAPSWINEFKSSNGGYQSAPMGAGGDAFNNRETEEVKWVSEDKGQKAHSSANVSSSSERDLVPKPLSMDSSGSQVRSPNSQRVPTKRKEKGSKGVRRRKENSGKQKEDPTSDEAPSQSRRIPNKCKKKKKFKDMDGSGKPSAKLPSKQVSNNGSEDALEDRGIGEIKG